LLIDDLSGPDIMPTSFMHFLDIDITK